MTAAAELLEQPLDDLLAEARELRTEGHGNLVTYSPKVFIPLTKLCRDVCHYCTFARPPRRGERAFMRADEVLAIARAGADAGCHEALFTLGDKPELRYRAAREELAELGYETTLEYLARMCELVLAETGLLPHANPGVHDRRPTCCARERSPSRRASCWRQRRSGSPRAAARTSARRTSSPRARLATIAAAGRAAVPFTSGILIGIGETREERLDALLAMRDAA